MEQRGCSDFKVKMMFGFNNKRKRNTVIGGGDWDRDGVRNVKDCEPFNWKKQGPKHKRKTGVCSFCGKRKPAEDLRPTVDGRELVCKYLDECEELSEL